MSHEARLKADQLRIEEALGTYFREACAQETLLEAMRYSLLAGGSACGPH
jgi:hypothetical protein